MALMQCNTYTTNEQHQSEHSILEQLHDDIKLMIVYACCSANAHADRKTLKALYLLSTQFITFMRLHRLAVVEHYIVKISLSNGTTRYEFCGHAHRGGDQPAVITSTSQSWYRYGKLHRDDDKPAVISTNGFCVWWFNGVIHRDGGPAVIYSDGAEKWYYNGKQHRGDGLPAFIDDINGRREWWIHGVCVRTERK